MKLEALDHPKTLELAAQLGVEVPTAIGYLELLWAFTGKKTPRGDVGKWSDAVIASACMWRGKPGDFVQALIHAGYADADVDHRLLVHDWSQHCPNWVRAKLKRDGVEFALKSTLKTETNADTNGATKTETSRADLNQAKTSEAKGSEAHVRALNVSRETISPDFDAWVQSEYPQCTGRRLWSTALHDAAVIVTTAKATEADLRRRVTGYRAFVDGNGVSGPERVYTPQNFFALHAEDAPWRKEWEAPKSKAQRHQDSNIDAASRWLAGSNA